MFAFSGSFGAAWGSAGAVVSVVGVDGEGADDLAGGGVDDADVEVMDEGDDGGSVEGSSESDVMEFAVDAEGDFAVVDAVVADAELGVRVVVVGAGFGAGVVDSGGGCSMWE